MNCMFSNNEESSSSGCESGWTIYLEHYSSINYPYASFNQENHEFLDDGRKNELLVAKRLEEEEEEEDLSMVSDASSGPPHLHEEEEEDEGYGGSNVDSTNKRFYHYPVNKDDTLFKNNKKNREKRRSSNSQDQSSLLDDTASSPFSDFSDKSFTLTRSRPSVENVLEYSQGYSSTQFEVCGKKLKVFVKAKGKLNN